MPIFRKKPIKVEAHQFDGTRERGWQIEAWSGYRVRFVVNMVSPNDYLSIHTPEGEMTAQTGDWVIKGVAGEFYPCKSDIFNQTYEPA